MKTFQQQTAHASAEIEKKMRALLFFSQRSSSQEVAGYNEPRDSCHTHKFLPARVKLDLIICSSVDKIKI